MLRFASSPTGDMHIGNLREALFNYIISKQKNENLIVRIEDIEQDKNIDGKDQEILDLLNLFDIEYTQVIHQSQNIRFHTAMALELIHEKKAFSCFCSNNWLDKKREESKNKKDIYLYDDACRNLPDELVIDNTNPFTIRVNKPKETIIIDDIAKGELSIKANTIDSFIIMNQNKIPTYDFASAIDDMISDISLVIESENHINSAAKQNHIRNLLKYNKKIVYAQLPNIVDIESFSVKSLLEEGFLPSSIANYLILIGNETPKEIFNITDAIEWFNFKDISTSSTRFDINKLKSINAEHLKNLDDKELSRYVGFADADIGKLAKVYLEQVKTTKELKLKIESIFSEKNIPLEFEKESSIIKNIIINAPYFDQYDDFVNYIINKSKIKDDVISIILQLLFTGDEDGPEIKRLYKYLKNYIGEIIK